MRGRRKGEGNEEEGERKQREEEEEKEKGILVKRANIKHLGGLSIAKLEVKSNLQELKFRYTP